MANLNLPNSVNFITPLTLTPEFNFFLSLCGGDNSGSGNRGSGNSSCGSDDGGSGNSSGSGKDSNNGDDSGGNDRLQ